MKAAKHRKKAGSSKSVAPRKRSTRSRRRRQQWHQAVIADYARLMAWPSVERVALGWKERRGKVTRRMSVKVYVREKRAALAKHEKIPRFVGVLVPTARDRYKSVRVPTDVVWHAPAGFCAASSDFLNPVRGGAMIAVPGHEAGTVACMVANAVGKPFALTAGHVIRSVEGPVPANVAIVQPPPPAPPLPPGASVLCGRTAGGFFGNTPQGFLDFALIDLSGRTGVSSALDDVQGNGPVLGTAFIVNNNLTATKFGAMTGRTSGIFAGIVPSVTVDGISVTNVFEFVGAPGTPFGQRGDSGSLVISTSPGSTGGLIGLLFAVTPATPDAPSGRGFVVPFDRIPGVRPV